MECAYEDVHNRMSLYSQFAFKYDIRRNLAEDKEDGAA